MSAGKDQVDGKGPAIRSLDEVEQDLREERFPLSGITPLGTAEFHIEGMAPFFGVVMHAGSRVRPDMLGIMEASVADRHREEDGHTDSFVAYFPIRIVARDSRFEYDLNREPERSVYSSIHGAFGIRVWKKKVTGRDREFTLGKHAEFHALIDLVTAWLLNHYDRILVYDMHSYCYRREKEQRWFEDPRPEINIGTKAVNRDLFGPVIDAFKREFDGLTIEGRPVRLAENELFSGGYLSRRLSRAHYDRVLVLAIEFKKMYMDEWSGELYDDRLLALKERFRQAVQKILPMDQT